MKQICTALGIGQVKDTSQFHDKPLNVSIDVELDEYGTNKRNDGEKVYRNSIKAYEGAPSKPVLAAAGFDYDDDMPFWLCTNLEITLLLKKLKKAFEMCANKIIRLPAFIQKSGLSRTTIYRLMK